MRIAALWGDQPLERVLSSPFVRCVETVQPLADVVGVAVEPTQALAEGHADAALELIAGMVGEGAALCTHGDVIPAVLRSLERQGVTVVDQWTWAKGSTWVLHADAGAFIRATYVPRPL